MTARIISEFIEVPANKRSLIYRKKLFGIGINDAPYMVRFQGVCPYYSTWKNMLGRCYDPKYQEKNTTYIGCTVTLEWHLFSNFKHWMVQQDWKDNDLDKDIRYPGNRVYSPDKCIFISKTLNNLLNGCNARRGKYPQGVAFDKTNKNYRAFLSYSRKLKSLGRFSTPEEASTTYRKSKSKHVLKIASKQSDPHIQSGLIKHALLMRESNYGEIK